MELPYLDVKNADVFESPDLYTREFADLSHAVAVTLIKIRLLVDLKALQHSIIVSEKLPQELVDNTREQLVSNIIAGNNDILKSKDLGSQIKQIEGQVEELCRAVQKDKGFFWPALLDPKRHLGVKPPYYSRGSESEMQIYLSYAYDSWNETPGAIDMIRERLKNIA